MRTPGVILEAVTTSVSRIPASYPIPPFVILHIALASCFRHSISYLMRIDLPPMYHRIVQARTMFFLLFSHWNIVVYCYNLNTKVRYKQCLYESCLVFRACVLAHSRELLLLPRPSAPPTPRNTCVVPQAGFILTLHPHSGPTSADETRTNGVLTISWLLKHLRVCFRSHPPIGTVAARCARSTANRHHCIVAEESCSMILPPGRSARK